MSSTRGPLASFPRRQWMLLMVGAFLLMGFLIPVAIRLARNSDSGTPLSLPAGDQLPDTPPTAGSALEHRDVDTIADFVTPTVESTLDSLLGGAETPDGQIALLELYDELANGSNDPDGALRARIIRRCAEFDDGALGLQFLLELVRCHPTCADPMFWPAGGAARDIYKLAPEAVDLALFFLATEQSSPATHLLFSSLFQYDYYDDASPGELQIADFDAVCWRAFSRASSTSELRVHLLGGMINLPGFEELGVDMVENWLSREHDSAFIHTVLTDDAQERRLLNRLGSADSPELLRLRRKLTDSIASRVVRGQSQSSADIGWACELLILLGEADIVNGWLSNPPPSVQGHEHTLVRALETTQEPR